MPPSAVAAPRIAMFLIAKAPRCSPTIRQARNRFKPLLAARANDQHRPYPQFLDHRAYRPREEDARRPADPGDRRAYRPRDERQPASARQHGHRARARDYDQGADRAARMEGL